MQLAKGWGIMKRDLQKGAAVSVSAIAMLFLPTIASGQTKIEQMVVTATKRSLDIQQVPASISAFSGESLDSRQIKTIDDLSHATPNITFSAVGGFAPQLSIRGVSADATSPLIEQTVALHIDGVYQPRPFSFAATMGDLDSVEVLRGPQGTVYGRNANAGVINLNTAKPTDTFQASGTIFGGNYGRYGARGYISGPIAQGISGRLFAVVDRRKGWGKNLTNGHTVDGDFMYSSRASVRFEPASNVVADFSVSQYFDHSTMPYYAGSAPLQGAGLNFTRAQQAGYDVRFTTEPWRVYNTYDPEVNSKMVSASGIIRWDITPDITLKSITGWQYATSHSYQDNDVMPLNAIMGKGFVDSHTWSQEFNLSARVFDRLDLVGGLYYLHDVVRGGNLNPLPLGSPFVNTANDGLLVHNLLEQRTKSKAAFIDATFSVADDLRILAGVRRTVTTKNTISNFQAFIDYFNVDAPVIAGVTATRVGGCGPNFRLAEQVFASTTGKVGLQYDFTPEITGYVQWQNGFKDGGYNSGSCANPYLPEQVYSWEAGIKTRLFNDAMTLNITYFDYKYANMQLSRIVNVVVNGVPTFSNVVDNAASASLKGAEIEARANVTDNLAIDLGIGILDGKYGPLTSFNAAIPGSPFANLTGFQLPRAPKLNINAGLEYTMRIGDLGELKTRGEYNYISTQYQTPFHDAISTQAGYSVWNALFTFTPDNCDVTFQAYVRNIGDKAYRTSAIATSVMFFSRVNWAPPRTFGGEITAKF